MSEMNNNRIRDILDNFISDYGVPKNFKFDVPFVLTRSKTRLNQMDYIMGYTNIALHINGLI